MGPGPFAKLLNEFVSQRSYFLLASLNYLMNLFPRRSYFLLAISMGPTSLYPDKPSPKNDPFFWYIEKEPQRPYDQNGGSIAPRSLIFDPFVNETVSQQTHVLGGGGDGGGRISRPSQTPSHHAGITYPVRVPPLTPTILLPPK